MKQMEWNRPVLMLWTIQHVGSGCEKAGEKARAKSPINVHSIVLTRPSALVLTRPSASRKRLLRGPSALHSANKAKRRLADDCTELCTDYNFKNRQKA